VNQVSSKLINHCRAFPFLVLCLFFSRFLPHQLPSSCTALYTLSVSLSFSLASVNFNKNWTAGFHIDYDSVQLSELLDLVTTRVMMYTPPNKRKLKTDFLIVNIKFC
jgi:hypothetical protein